MQTRAAGSPPPNQVTVEMVNDSGLEDNQVFVMVSTPEAAGQQIQGPITLVSNSGSSSVSGTGVSLASLGAMPGKIVQSPFTGKARPVYSFAIDNLKSGQVNFSYNTPVKIVNGAAPTANEKYRFDKMEITYLSANRSGGGNLTSIDFYAIPLQVEVFHAGSDTPDPLQTKSFYASTGTLLQTLAAMSSGMASGAGWSRAVDGTTFHPRSTDFTSFARILSPNTIAAADNTAASCAPYPSFAAYLQSLVGMSFALNGTQNGGYRYTATVQSDGTGGFEIVCTGTTNQTPAPPPPPGQDQQPVPAVAGNATVTLHLPKGQPGQSMDFFIYACVANQNSYSVEGYPFSGDTATINRQVGYINSTAYGSLVGDVQAALDFGYPNGKFVAPNADIDALFGTPVVLPYPYPYGGARTRNDGFYNPYAGMLYYLSDAYGHPFSDRLDAASPLYQLVAGDTIRITILPDVRLDAPIVSITGQTDTSLSLSWNAVEGATGYSIALSPAPGGNGTTSIPAAPGPTQSTTLSGLSAGTPYLVSVTATGPNATSSNSLPVQGVTAGTRAPANQGVIKFQANLNLPNGLSNLADLQVSINGQPVSPTRNASIAADFGGNVVGLAIQSKSSGQTVYLGNYFLTFVSQDGGTQFTFGEPFTFQYNLTPLTTAPPGDRFPVAGNPLVVGTPFTPKPFFEFFQTVFPR